MNRLEGRVALVTGAASGIGKATAQRLVEEGAAVLVTDIQVDAGEATVQELDGRRRPGRLPQARRQQRDATGKPHAPRRSRSSAALDILVNNAGMGDIKPIEETTLAEWDRTVAIDQTGVFLGMKVRRRS